MATPSADDQFTRRMVRTVLTVAVVIVLAAALWAARDALMLIYVSALIAMGFSPLVRFIERPSGTGRRRVPRTFAILAIYLVIIGVVILLGLLVVPPLIEQATQLWDRLPTYFSRAQHLLIRYGLIVREITLKQAVQNAPASAGSNAAGAIFVAFWGVVGGVFGIITIVILSFYLLTEAESMFRYVTRFVPAMHREAFTIASRQAVNKVSAWLRAQLMLAGVMGVFAAVGLGLMGEPFFYVVALVAAIGETVPVIGPIIGGLTAVAVALMQSPGLALKVGVYFLILHQLEANILVPKIMERRVGVSPVTVMVALLIGGSLWGLIGAILAIPTAAILSVIFEEVTAVTIRVD